MEPPLPAVEIDESVDTVFADLSAGNPAVVVARSGRPVGRPHPRRPPRVPAPPAASGSPAAIGRLGPDVALRAVDFETRAIHEGQEPDPGHRGGDPADLPDVDVRPGRRRRQQGLRLRADRKPDAGGARDLSRLARRRRPRARLLLRPGGDDDDHAPRQPGRPRRLRQRRLRRHVPHVLADLRAEGLRLHVRLRRRASTPGSRSIWTSRRASSGSRRRRTRS